MMFYASPITDGSVDTTEIDHDMIHTEIEVYVDDMITA